MGNFKDYYEILGVDRYASAEEIKKAFKTLAKKYHPDISTEKDAEERFKEINEAYEQLSGNKNAPITKAEYDAKWDAHKAKEKQQQSTKRSSYTTGEKSHTNGSYRKQAPDFDYQNFNRRKRPEKPEKAKGVWKTAWDEVRAEERKDPFVKRHTIYDKELFKDEELYEERTTPEEIIFQMKRGTLHVASEAWYQLKKLGQYTTDTIPKFVIRNRKTITCVILAGTIAFSAMGASTSSKPRVESQQTTISEDYASNEDITLSDASKEQEEIVVYRKYKIEYGDSISQLAVDANCDQSEILSKNHISDKNSIYAGTDIIIPYHIDKDDLKYATTSVSYEHPTSLSDFAAEHSTTAESITKLNPEAVDNGFIVSDTVLVPNFASQAEIKVQKEMAAAKAYSKANQ